MRSSRDLGEILVVSASEDAESPRGGVSDKVKGVVSGRSASSHDCCRTQLWLTPRGGFSLPSPPSGTIWLLCILPNPGRGEEGVARMKGNCEGTLETYWLR